MKRTLAHLIDTVCVLLLGALLAVQPMATPAARAQGAQPTAAELQMPEDAAPFRRVAEQFVARAVAGDGDGTLALLSPAIVARTGEAAVRGMLSGRILPFFVAARPAATPGRSVTVTRTTDASGNRGFAFYMWATPRDTRDGPTQRPFTVYVVEEAGRLVVANVVPDRLVEGRHR